MSPTFAQDQPENDTSFENSDGEFKHDTVNITNIMGNIYQATL